MNEPTRLAELLAQAYAGEPDPGHPSGRATLAWHGPSIRSVLAGVGLAAARRRVGQAHSIWEITLHIACWDEICRRRLEGERITITTGDPGDWPAPPSATSSNWSATLSRLFAAQEALVRTVGRLPARALSATTHGCRWTNRLMIHGTLHHDLYHAGQIALLRRVRSGQLRR